MHFSRFKVTEIALSGSVQQRVSSDHSEILRAAELLAHAKSRCHRLERHFGALLARF